MTEHHTQFKVKHPLNDETVFSIWKENADYQSTVKTLTRAGADWQLKQVIEWIKNELGSGGYLQPKGYYGHEIDVDDVIEDLKKAMRPQEGE